ncbi:methionine synthase-like protein [Cystobasidium minutum MCA 4210]|uniref:methionine synthase-like protein n=1 Tax=Cystobasidium minutum MCA 4210 TaxID=1397322 RepID=UPI0034CD27AF|eukprot:jgi/Rhomi1/169051/fgenesh1_kg.3_\
MAAPAKRNPPFRAEQLGSLLRPEELIQKRYAVAKGEADASDLQPLEDASVKEIVKLQQDCGIHPISDGEYRRHMFWGRTWETFNGMEEIQTGSMKGYDESIFRAYAPDVASFLHDKAVPNSVTVCTGKISHPGKSSNLPEFEYMKSLVPESEWKNIKLTLISPSWYHFRYAPGRAYSKEAYSSDEQYFADAAKAYQVELKILYDAGLRNVQIDDPNLAYFCSESMLKGWAEDKGNTETADEMFDKYIQYYNACFERPEDMHLGVHLCRGNYIGGRHFSEGAYDRIAKKLFQNLNVDTFYLEYDTPRAGGFEPLAHLPKNKNVILGVLSSKFPKLEDQQEMVDRVYKAADIIASGSNETREEALKRIGVSCQCGFASHAEGNPIKKQDMINKLKLVRAIADQVWPGEP